MVELGKEYRLCYAGFELIYLKLFGHIVFLSYTKTMIHAVFHLIPHGVL